jgi:hypothetical protein
MFIRMKRPTMGDNFTPREILHHWGPTSPLGVKFCPWGVRVKNLDLFMDAPGAAVAAALVAVRPPRRLGRALGLEPTILDIFDRPGIGLRSNLGVMLQNAEFRNVEKIDNVKFFGLS